MTKKSHIELLMELDKRRVERLKLKLEHLFNEAIYNPLGYELKFVYYEDIR